ncbi:MAG TPA: amidohydrolase family protein [Chloroflexota bacterium]|nr:amidohydrolase family protein [Chloroflexota bacterium]
MVLQATVPEGGAQVVERVTGRIVDTHVHAGLTKYEPIESLVDQMFRHRVDHAVLVQHAGEFDNRYLIECARRFPGRFVVACLVDVTQPDAADRLTEWVERSPAVQGVRVYLSQLFGGAAGAEGLWQRANELGLNLTVAGSLRELASAEMERIPERYPHARLHLEHLAHPDPKEPAPHETYRRALSLSRYPNVALKVSGFYSFTTLPWSPYLDTLPFVELALEAFGARRMMWGSDFPPVSFREGYHNTLRFAQQHVPLASAEERAYLLGRTALSHWRFDLTP